MPNRNVYLKDPVDRKLALLAIEAEKQGDPKNTPTLIAADIVEHYFETYKAEKQKEWNPQK